MLGTWELLTYTQWSSVEKTISSQVFFHSQDEAPPVALKCLPQRLAKVFQCVEMSLPTAVRGDASCVCQPASMPPSGREAWAGWAAWPRGERGIFPQVPAPCPCVPIGSRREVGGLRGTVAVASWGSGSCALAPGSVVGGSSFSEAGFVIHLL